MGNLLPEFREFGQIESLDCGVERPGVCLLIAPLMWVVSVGVFVYVCVCVRVWL